MVCSLKPFIYIILYMFSWLYPYSMLCFCILITVLLYLMDKIVAGNFITNQWMHVFHLEVRLLVFPISAKHQNVTFHITDDSIKSWNTLCLTCETLFLSGLCWSLSFYYVFSASCLRLKYWTWAHFAAAVAWHEMRRAWRDDRSVASQRKPMEPTTRHFLSLSLYIYIHLGELFITLLF